MEIPYNDNDLAFYENYCNSTAFIDVDIGCSQAAYIVAHSISLFEFSLLSPVDIHFFLINNHRVV